MTCKQLKEGNGYIEQLKQLTTLTWSGDLISKSYTEALVKNHLCDTVGRNEYYIINNEGTVALEKLGILRI